MLGLVDDDDRVRLDRGERAKKRCSVWISSCRLTSRELDPSFEDDVSPGVTPSEDCRVRAVVVDDREKRLMPGAAAALPAQQRLPVPISPVMTTNGSRRSSARQPVRAQPSATSCKQETRIGPRVNGASFNRKYGCSLPHARDGRMGSRIASTHRGPEVPRVTVSLSSHLQSEQNAEAECAEYTKNTAYPAPSAEGMATVA